MDIEKLIEDLQWWAEHCDRTNYGCETRTILSDAATAISTLQIENQALRNSANGFKAENEKLRAELEKELAARKKQADILYELKGQKYEQTQIIDKLRVELEQVKKKNKYSAHDVALILSDAFGDSCACNFNGNDEWLPEKCELLDACPDVVGVACWEQYLKWRGIKIKED